jgi:hypothetical protein
MKPSLPSRKSTHENHVILPLVFLIYMADSHGFISGFSTSSRCFLPFSPHLGLKASSNGFGHLPTDLATPDAVADTHRRRSDPVGQWQRGKGGADGLVL